MKVYLRADTEETSWDDVMTRMEVAQRENLRPTMLEKLVHDPHYRVREALAANRTVPVAILKQLADDEDSSVRIKVAYNPNTPTKVVLHMVRHNPFDTCAGQALAQRRNASPQILEELSHNKNPYVLTAVADNPNTPSTVLTTLAKNLDWEIRLHVCSNPNTPTPVLAILAKDRSSAQVRRHAQNMLEYRHEYQRGE